VSNLPRRRARQVELTAGQQLILDAGIVPIRKQLELRKARSRRSGNEQTMLMALDRTEPRREDERVGARGRGVDEAARAVVVSSVLGSKPITPPGAESTVEMTSDK
jgi:hypothetical protein